VSAILGTEKLKNSNEGGKAMRKKVLVISLCVVTVISLMGMRGCSLIGVTPATLNFTVEDVQNEKSQKVLVWSKLPLWKMHFKVECEDDWVDVNPVEFDSIGPWDRESVSVKVNTSVLESTNTGILESGVKISAKFALTGQEVPTSANVAIKVNLGGTGQTGGNGGDGNGGGNTQ